MKKVLSLLMAVAILTAMLIVPVSADSDIWAAIAGDNGTTYVNLFDVILSDDNYQIWFDDCAAIMGEENAAETVSRLQKSISSDQYGEAATAAYGTTPQGAAFDCFYINGLKSVTFVGNTATMVLEDGSSETHTYEYVGQYLVGEGERMVYYGMEFEVAFPCDVYKSTDEAGEFNYFFLRDDTMEETYHIEFRYGKNLEDLQGYFVGPYAYWLTAGFDANADEHTLKNVIDLFCLENLDYSSHTDAALVQLKELGFIGSWDADLSPLGDAYADIDLSMAIDENGHGITMMNGVQTADFEAYAYDSGEKGDGAGLYVAYSNLEYEAESAPYILSKNEDDALVLTLTAEDGTISWVKQNVEVIEIANAEELAAINENLSGSYILTADIDLGGVEWTPLGTWAPSGETEEEMEIPAAEYAFTGTFDGNGHTISNLVIDQQGGYALGLFGCIAGASVGNFTLENASVSGDAMVAAAVGYTFFSEIHDVNLVNGTITAYPNEMASEGMYAGIAGAGNGSIIKNCTAFAAITIPDNAANAGIIGGGLQTTSVIGCYATGTVTAGDNCYGLGGVSGCGFGSDEFTDNVAENVLITAGDNCFWIGGITGYAGGYGEEYGVPVTIFTNNIARNVVIAAEGAEGVDGIVGAGFYSEELVSMGAPFDAPTVFELIDSVIE